MNRHFDPAKSLTEFLASHDMTAKPSYTPAKTSAEAIIESAKSAAADLVTAVKPALELRAQKVAIVKHMFRVAAHLS